MRSSGIDASEGAASNISLYVGWPLLVRSVRVLFAREHTLRRSSGSKVGDRPVIGSYPRPLWRSRWRPGRSLHLGVIGHAGGAALSVPASQKTMPP
jgi:hypothetical protein